MFADFFFEILHASCGISSGAFGKLRKWLLELYYQIYGVCCACYLYICTVCIYVPCLYALIHVHLWILVDQNHQRIHPKEAKTLIAIQGHGYSFEMNFS